MRRSKEIVFLFALLFAAMAFVLWYVIDRRAKNRAAPSVATRALAPEPPPAAPGPLAPTSAAPTPLAQNPDVTLGGANEAKTIDFSSGKPLVKDTPEDQAALNAALKEMAEATKDVVIPPPKPPQK